MVRYNDICNTKIATNTRLHMHEGGVSVGISTSCYYSISSYQGPVYPLLGYTHWTLVWIKL